MLGMTDDVRVLDQFSSRNSWLGVPVQVLGSTRKNLTGFSSTTVLSHTGYIFYSGK